MRRLMITGQIYCSKYSTRQSTSLSHRGSKELRDNGIDSTSSMFPLFLFGFLGLGRAEFVHILGFCINNLISVQSGQAGLSLIRI